jgi:type II secretory pathway component PulF
MFTNLAKKFKAGRESSTRMGKIEHAYLRYVFFNTKERIAFYRMLFNLTSNGISIQSALILVKGKYDQLVKKRSELNKIIADILRLMRSGIPFHRALMSWIPSQEYLLLESCYQDIPRALGIMTQHGENLKNIQNALIGALTYPVVMMIMLIGVLVTLAFYIMPNMAKLAPPDKWPPMSYSLYELANFIADYYAVLSLIIISALLFIAYSLSRVTAPYCRDLLDKLPPWNIYKGYTSIAFLLALSSSIKLGASFNTAVIKIHRISTQYLQSFLRKMNSRLKNGNSFGDAVDVGLFDDDTLVNLSVYASTNKLEQGIQYLAEHNLLEHRAMIEKRGKVLGYFVMAFVATMIGWIILAMYGMQSAVAT